MTNESRWQIDPGSWLLTGLDIHRQFTEDAWSQEAWPLCPVCGTTVTVEFITAPDLEGGWTYQCTGQWTCNSGCHHPR